MSKIQAGFTLTYSLLYSVCSSNFKIKYIINKSFLILHTLSIIFANVLKKLTVNSVRTQFNYLPESGVY